MGDALMELETVSSIRFRWCGVGWAHDSKRGMWMAKAHQQSRNKIVLVWVSMVVISAATIRPPNAYIYTQDFKRHS